MHESGLMTTVDVPTYMFNGIETNEAEEWAATLTASPLNTGVLSNDGYSAVPCAYVVLDEDACLPQMYQNNMIALQSQRGNVFTVYHAPSGHSPHLSWTEHVGR
ncbi:hypothetical protein N8T08_004337 [Aspergillus melleus]|uniref:Uncharacterized protein n=1 Tax=Aspergillus melleus TaxID=138277 RepID=A0ACC3B5E9_9EURO|nr:hypothetical protein N8T08_004337 [Aspergillus melleus]